MPSGKVYPFGEASVIKAVYIDDVEYVDVDSDALNSGCTAGGGGKLPQPSRKSLKPSSG